MQLQRLLTSAQGRLTTGTALVVAIVVGLWPDHARPVDPVRLGAVLTAAMAWLFAELAGPGEPRPHDLKLFELLVSKLPEQFLSFLRDHDFGAAYHDPGVGGLYDVAAWQGARYEFVDPALQKRWATLRGEARKFAHDLSHNTFPDDVNANWYTVHPTNGDPGDPQPFVVRRIDLLNAGASALAGRIDEFEGYARERLRL